MERLFKSLYGKVCMKKRGPLEKGTGNHFNILAFSYCSWVLKARILKWFPVPFSSGPRFFIQTFPYRLLKSLSIYWVLLKIFFSKVLYFLFLLVFLISFLFQSVSQFSRSLRPHLYLIIYVGAFVSKKFFQLLCLSSYWWYVGKIICFMWWSWSKILLNSLFS